MPKAHVTHSKTAKLPSRPYEADRLGAEIKQVGFYGLQCKRELYVALLTLSKLRSAARYLLTLSEDDPVREYRGKALLRRVIRLGLLDSSSARLDYILGLTPEILLERRLQSVVFTKKLAKSIHQARVLIRQGHIRVDNQICNRPGLMVRPSSQVEIHENSSILGRRPGRVAKAKLRARNAQ